MKHLPVCPECGEDELYMPHNMTSVRKNKKTEVSCYVCSFCGEIDITNNEIWKDVVGYEGHYKISSIGNIISTKFGYEKKISLMFDSHGYYYFTPCMKNKSKKVFVHHTALDTFVGKRKIGQQCRHLNGIKTDNCIANLTWGTAKENAQDKRKHGTLLVGENANPRRLFKREEVFFVLYLIENGVCKKAITKMMKCKISAVYAIWSGNSYVWMTGIKKEDKRLLGNTRKKFIGL